MRKSHTILTKRSVSGCETQMGSKQSSASKQVEFMSTIEREASMSTRRRTVVPSKSEIPTPFSKFQSFSEEWNLCGMYDPTRRVNVVSDLKLQRKRLPHLLVEKCVIMQATESLHLVRNELEMHMFLVRYCQLNIGYMHPNIVQLRGFYTFRKKIHVFVEFCEFGSLNLAYIVEPNPLLRLNFSPTESDARDAMWQICSAVAFLHTNGVAHCDLAFENIFVTRSNVLKVGDFDHAVFVGTENQKQIVKDTEPLRHKYGAPELYVEDLGVREPIDLQKADMWALGIVLIKLFTKKPIFDSASPHDRSFQLFRELGLRAYLRNMYFEQTAICKFSDDMLYLLDGLLQVDPMQRMSITEAMGTQWLQLCELKEEEVGFVED